MTLIQYSIKKINDMSKKQKFSYLIIISLFVIAIVITRVTDVQADIIRILDVRTYTVKNVSFNIYDKVNLKRVTTSKSK